MNIKYIITCLLITLMQLSLGAQCPYKGKILDQNTSEPLVGATIIAGERGLAVTNYNGEFNFSTNCDIQSFTVSYVGYEKQIIATDDLKGNIKLATSNQLMNQIVVTAKRDAQERADAPIAISAISTDVLEDTKPTRLEEVLNKVEGVYMVDLGNEQHTMAIRQPINYKGLFLYLEDGLPIRPTGIFNHNALLEMNMAALRRIEVVRGPASSMYGSEAIGGALNFITLRPAAVPTGRVSLQGNNNGYRRVDLNASTTVGNLGIGISSYYAKRENGFRDHSDFNKWATTFRADYLVNDHNSFTFDISYIDYYADMTGSLDSSFFYSKDYSSQHTFTNRAVDALRSKLVYNHYWDNGGKTMVAGFLRKNSIKQNPSYRVKDDYSPWGNPSGNKLLAHGEINDNSVSSSGFIVQHQNHFDLLKGVDIMVGASVDHSPNTYNAKYIAIDKSDQKIYTNFTKTDSVLSDYKVNLVNYGAYINVAAKLSTRLQVTAALRYDKLDFDFTNNLDETAFSGAPDDVDNFSAITPKLGLTYSLAKNSGLFANYSIGFLPPQISELYRGVKIPVLEPATYYSYEVGGWFNLLPSLNADFSAYLMDGNNEIISVKLDNGSRENRNAGQTRHIGVEYGLNWSLTEDLTWRVSGTNASHKFIDYVESGKDYSDNVMGQAPSWIMNSEITYKPSYLPGFRSSLEWQHVDKYYMDNANSLEYPGYDIFNLRLGYTYKGIEFWTNVMNVSNKLYATVARKSRWGESYSVGEPRAFNVGIAYNFESKK